MSEDRPDGTGSLHMVHCDHCHDYGLVENSRYMGKVLCPACLYRAGREVALSADNID